MNARWVGTALLLAGAAVAATDAERAAVEQRIRLTQKLIADSATAQRITSSGNVQAVSHLDEGRLHHSHAEDLLKQGDVEGARKAVDEALKHVSSARRLVPDAPARQAAARQRYEQAGANLDRLIDSWRARAGAAEAQDGDLVSAIGLVQTARWFAGEQRFEEAVHTLDSAERHVLAGMNRLLGQKTLDYTARASTPAEEYQLEAARHQGLIELLPLALREMKPREDARALIERYGQDSRALRSQAERRFQAGEIQPAIADIRNATLFAQRALGAAGVVTPAATEGTPP